MQKYKHSSSLYFASKISNPRIFTEKRRFCFTLKKKTDAEPFDHYPFNTKIENVGFVLFHLNTNGAKTEYLNAGHYFSYLNVTKPLTAYISCTTLLIITGMF